MMTPERMMMRMKEKNTVAEAQVLDEAGDRGATEEGEPPLPSLPLHDEGILLRGFDS